VNSFRGISVLVATVVVAAIVGFGIPLGWVWIASQVQGGSNSSSLEWSSAMLIMFGIIFTYAIVLYVAGWVITRVEPDSEEARRQQSTSRSPWMRGMTDTRAIRPKGADRVWGIETVFVGTTLIVTAAFWLWFIFLAGSPLPTQ
jgi:hypothetical protein